ncbi:MAG: transaldolase [Candidatus Magasanikbacteria bacterium]|nr:transaldolase [Candidatus Magasanikbacteria bacterium]
MRPAALTAKIFLDGADPAETQQALALLGFLDGQTTNPTLLAKNPAVNQRLAGGAKFTTEELRDRYRTVVTEISALIPAGSVSVEVYADTNSTAEAMRQEGREMYSWIPNAHIKFPTTTEGLRAAAQAAREGLRVNLTLCFSQEQAAAVYAATKGAAPGQVYVSPFVGRLDDRGESGMDVIANIIKMYRAGDGHVLVLTASVRTLSHLYYALALKSDIITAPLRVLSEWAQTGLSLPPTDFAYNHGTLRRLPYQELDLNRPWQSFNLTHPLTARGLELFSNDWNDLID